MSSYATLADLTQLGIASAALSGIGNTDRQAALDAGSTMADGYLGSQFKLPLISPFPLDLRMHVCAVAAFILLKTRGFDPENPTDMAIRDGYTDAVKWFRDVADGRAIPVVTDSQEGGTVSDQFGPLVQTPTKDSQGNPTTGSPKPRGW